MAESEGCVTNLNAVAQSLTGWTNADAVGRPLESIFHIVNEGTRRKVENPVARALRQGTVVGLANHTLLIAKDGSERPIDDSAAPIRSKEGQIVGCVLVFGDVTERKLAENVSRFAGRFLSAVHMAGGPTTTSLFLFATVANDCRRHLRGPVRGRFAGTFRPTCSSGT